MNASASTPAAGTRDEDDGLFERLPAEYTNVGLGSHAPCAQHPNCSEYR